LHSLLFDVILSLNHDYFEAIPWWDTLPESRDVDGCALETFQENGPFSKSKIIGMQQMLYDNLKSDGQLLDLGRHTNKGEFATKSYPLDILYLTK
jgi:hypothetical protein